MARRTYTDRDRAVVYAELTVNDGNIKRTARNTGYDVSFVRRCKTDWERNGVSEAVMEEVKPIVADFLADAIRIRNRLLLRLEELLEGDKVSLAQVSTAFGIVSDKIRAYEAINDPRRVEHTLVLPPADELRELFSGLMDGVVESARTRAAEIEAHEEPVLTTFRELPVAKEENV
jgi:hypothetical protein